MRSELETRLTDAVIARLSPATDPRFRRIMTSLIRHVHDFVREVELTEEEWFEGIKFLTATGQKCDDRRQEFILMSDVLGVSMLVDAINHRSSEGTTETTVLGPFFVHGAPEIENGGDMAAGWEGEPTYVSGRVLSTDGKPIAGALLDVWQAQTSGLYDSQDQSLDGLHMRGKFRSDADGRYLLRTVLPVNYPIPSDGPVGAMLRATGRHPWRPAHIHFVVSADGYDPVTTHIFDRTDPYLESDAVFAVKPSLVCEFVRHEAPDAEAQRLGIAGPLYTVQFDFRLQRAGAAPTPRTRDAQQRLAALGARA
jgi:hydroxyquinol 1,2-dioxygenase